MYILKRWSPDPSKGEVFTPIKLVSEMVDIIPSHVWLNPKSLFLDPCMGKGTFLIEVVRRLVDIYGYSELDAKSRVFGYDIRVKYINYLKRRGYVNVQHKDFLDERIEMKFDVVLGNPPYQKQVGPKKTEAIWPKFVEKSFEICKEGGYVSLIHPSGWRNVEGNFSKTKNLLKSKNILYLEMHDEKDGVAFFNATTSFDWYVVENVVNNNVETTVKCQSGEITNINLNSISFIPSGNFDYLFSIIAKENEESVKILHSYSDYETRKPHMLKTQSELHIYPCIYTTLKDGTINFYWSSTNQRGHFNLAKLIWSNGMASTLVVDDEGNYGLTQFSYGLLDNPKNLHHIKKVMESDIFLKIINSCYMSSGDRFSHKILSTFRKDFWKDFLDEQGNIIEPNLYKNVG
jgi:16S rRNA G966 N2-methylase RsmD